MFRRSALQPALSAAAVLATPGRSGLCTASVPSDVAFQALPAKALGALKTDKGVLTPPRK